MTDSCIGWMLFAVLSALLFGMLTAHAIPEVLSFNQDFEANTG